MEIGHAREILAREVRRRTASFAGRFVLAFLVATGLATFVALLPAYRDSFTAAVASAQFDLDVAGCDCSAADVETISQLPGVTHVVPVLGVNDVPIEGPAGAAAGFAWVLDLADGGAATPIGPQRLLEGSWMLGTSASAEIVIDREVASAIGARVGDVVHLRLAGQVVDAQVAGIVRSALRFRGPSMAIGRFLVDPLLPADSPFKATPYTELLISGPVDQGAVARALAGRKTIMYSKAEHLAILESQIEVSQPVITIVSLIAALALAAFELLLAFLAIERRRAYLQLLPALGASRTDVIAGVVVLEALPASVALGLGGLVALALLVNTWFVRVGVQIDGGVAVGGAFLVAVGALAAQLLMLGLRREAIRP